MYLSRLLLNSRSADVRRDLANAHGLHRRVLSAFADKELEEGARKFYGVLFRADIGQSGDVALLVQSAESPDWKLLPNGYLIETFEPNPATTELTTLCSRISNGTRLRFRLRANVTKRLRPDGMKRGKRIEVVGPEALLGWLSRKSEASGFRLSVRQEGEEASALERFAVRVTEEGKLYGRKSDTTLTFGATLFDGELVVTDTQRFLDALRDGLGSAKAYGFGLLSVALT